VAFGFMALIDSLLNEVMSAPLSWHSIRRVWEDCGNLLVREHTSVSLTKDGQGRRSLHYKL